MNDLNLEVIYPKIHVYRGLFKDNAEFLEKLKSMPDWKAWWVFGEQFLINGNVDIKFDTFPSPETWESVTKDLDYFAKTIDGYFYKATADYVATHNIELDNWVHQIPSVCKYTSSGGVSDEYAMHVHTDFQQEKRHARGLKFNGVTCTMYLNDDYEGGEMVFRIQNCNEYDEVIYKPQAGDILVFPSKEPFFHGVKKMISGDRYFIRNFWLSDYPGSPEWLAGEAEHGPEKWAEMEKEREKEFRQHYKLPGY